MKMNVQHVQRVQKYLECKINNGFVSIKRATADDGVYSDNRRLNTNVLCCLDKLS